MEYIEEELLRVLDQKLIFEEVIDQSVRDLSDLLRKTIKERWLEGYSVDGGIIMNQFTGEAGYAQKWYEKLKISKNPRAGGSVDLTLTGRLGDKIIAIKLGSGDYEIISEDSKYMSIGSKYGFDEFGLTDSEMSTFMAMLENSVVDKLLNF